MNIMEMMKMFMHINSWLKTLNQLTVCSVMTLSDENTCPNRDHVQRCSENLLHSYIAG